MNKSELAIATMSLVRDAGEEKLLREALTELSRFGIPVFITDGGSHHGFLEFLATLPHVIVVETAARGLAAQVISSLAAAADGGAKHILYTEPDKILFFTGGMAAFIESAVVSDQTGVIVATRTQMGFDSYPPFQVMTETTINNCTTEITGVDIDYTYGPFLLNRSVVPCIAQVPADIAWGWRTFTFTAAYTLGLSIEEIKGDYCCPPDQGVDTPPERLYRMKQMCQSVEGAVLGTAVRSQKRG